ncbi:hypothetical protein [Sandarakinorhabdus rubra]|uniref:hypothetical protein n=1 Tax=Sandarakinorhabdus rubra TaxID=2672568 RepID=UPI0013DC1BEC|nr:hypothetical protein [Sandarakinorhabdus rubra]
MILHASLVADRPRETAHFLATLMGGQAFAMRGPGQGAWHAAGADPIGNYIEVLSNGTQFLPDEHGNVMVSEGARARASGAHILIESTLDEPGIMSAAAVAGVMARKVTNGFFDLIACWIDDCQLVEVLCPQMSRAYRALFEPERLQELAARLPTGIS